jgi:GcrA cell cycle regulator
MSDYWTPDRIAQLTQLWADGLSTAKIGDAIGASKNAVVGKAHRLNLPLRKSPVGWHGERCTVRAQVVRPVVMVPPLRAEAKQPCQWPTNGGRPWRFCSDPTVAGKPYCPDHCAIAYRKTAIQQAAA